MQPGSPAYDQQLRTWCEELDRLTARVQRPVKTCEGCRRFKPGAINPTAAMGRCGAGRGYFWPMERHQCRDREGA